ncbi:MAG: cytochrome bc1 complex Rieske iron-sulfur subunit [Egibacteraceae bacterium]
MSEAHPPDRAGRRVASLFLLSLIGSVAFAVFYSLDWNIQVLGIALGSAMLALGAGLVVWSKGLMPQGPFVEERPDVEPTAEEERAAVEAFVSGERAIGRRRLLGPLLAAAAGALGIVVLWPVRSLGPRPGNALRETGWRRGVRVVDETGKPVRLEDLEVGGVITAFPQGHVRSADSQTIIVRVAEAVLRPPPGRRDWSPGGHLAYSKVCTHAGCPVGLYQAVAHVLICPCHQASFDVLDAARPVFGPATRPLPQLPLGIDSEGFLVARGDFSEPVGPGFWELGPPPKAGPRGER